MLAAALVSGEPLRPPQRLADTGAFDAANRRFSPQYPLWSDGLTKRRSILLPKGTAIDTSDVDNWDFPVGTKFFKEFSLNGRKVETRMLWKASDAGWVPAAYVWNDAGTEATLASDEGVPFVAEVAPNKRHSIPARNECAACHGTTRPVPLGFTALQLSTDRDPNAIHGEPLSPEMLTLKTLLDERLLSPARTELVTAPPRIRTADPATRAVLGYLSANCAMCHNGNGEISALGPVIRYRELLADGDAVARSLLGQPTRFQHPKAPEGTTVLVNVDAPDLSAILFRMRSRSPSYQMPPLGTVVRDQKAVDAVSHWIASRR
jgi:mono/diheme cytochrome c family protein